MANSFAETLKTKRNEKKLSQQKLAELLFVDRSTISNWESGRRVPDAILIARIAEVLQVEVSTLLLSVKADVPGNVIIVDDEEILLSGAIPVLAEVLPHASITGFTKVSDAISFVENNQISIAFLDIELGKQNGLVLCDRLLAIDPLINIIFVTGYPDYALDAWETKACGFLVKPLRKEEVEKVLTKLRYPVRGALT